MPYVEVYVDESDLDTDELIDVLANRGYIVGKKSTIQEVDYELKEEVDIIVQMHRTSSPAWEERALNLLYNLAGKVV
jgi:hypothetical protein